LACCDCSTVCRAIPHSIAQSSRKFIVVSSNLGHTKPFFVASQDQQLQPSQIRKFQAANAGVAHFIHTPTYHANESSIWIMEKMKNLQIVGKQSRAAISLPKSRKDLAR